MATTKRPTSRPRAAPKKPERAPARGRGATKPMKKKAAPPARQKGATAAAAAGGGARVTGARRTLGSLGRTVGLTLGRGAELLEVLREELEAARHELARVAAEENSGRRDLEAQLSAVTSNAERLRSELEAVRLDLRTALADLEISGGERDRIEAKLQAAVRELVLLRDAERLAARASAEAREVIAELRRENAQLRAELEVRRPS